ncbi:Exonuclease RNase T and DNA polymerase III [Stanieria cyanosphaera PCC 7437]|uniref:Exonuclease RNase T and DNA polymerase III n=1 Tax=Stanieria cyanosphaera (strain ATCC 29371 / PCC 7437) TaxID=111780 RepID=K9XVT7_STAC7|nr:3'-5' exonuclease [Stanieria cyanosphaera]AFZ35787.1 Exonuclease RNase T and DNA polymerase III [Stanieria cyanosphaera PCC 7437]
MVNLENYQYFLIVDLEATCCDRKTIPRHQMEIIEIGAVIIEAKELNIISEFQTFIKPIRHPILTNFCQQLTSITQKQIDSALNYSQAIAVFKEWLYAYSNFIFGSWGDYDRKQFEQDCQFHQVAYPIASKHINLKKLFSTNQELKSTYGMKQALQLAKIELEGTHHRGIDDARNIAKLMPYILARKKIE